MKLYFIPRPSSYSSEIHGPTEASYGNMLIVVGMYPYGWLQQGFMRFSLLREGAKILGGYVAISQYCIF